MRSTLRCGLGALLAAAGCANSGDDTGTSASTSGPGSTGAAASTGGASEGPTPTTDGSGGPASTGAASGGDSTTFDPVVADPFTITVLDKQWISGTGGWDTQHKDVDFDLGVAPFAKVTLIVDLESPCYPFDKWISDPPPQGQNWPAKCDAFDRTMGFVIDPAATPDDPPGFEALRSITPFGGPSHIEEDITDWANARPGAHSLRSYINSWPDGAGKVSGSAGGWSLTVRLDVVPGEPPRRVLAAIPLFAGDVGADTPAPKIGFTLPEGTVKTGFSYRVSGHGGADDPSVDCIGPAEEFCKREHTVLLDGVELFKGKAWRSDCTDFCTLAKGFANNPDQSYCMENPCGAIQSVNAPRANWCPSAVVHPYEGATALAAGDHEFSFVIDNMYPGGSWTVSAVMYAYGE